jgi:predicted transcriptional regulator
MNDNDWEGGPPRFEDPFEEADVEQRIYAIIFQTREPTAASAIAERVGCDPKTARKYLRWFAQLGIVTEYEGRPTTYERNDSYFEWRRVNELAAEHSTDELQSRVRELTERIHEYEQQYDTATPANVDAVAAAEGDEYGTIDDVYGDLGDWTTAKHGRQLYERARQQHTGTGDREQASS